nr:transmembrane anchor protein [uncultured Duganella sp.]
MSQAIQGAIVAPKKELLRGMLIAAGVAAVLLLGAVLPAEYGIDPTGVGKALGLTRLSDAAAPEAPAAPSAAAPAAGAPGAAKRSTVAAKGEERALTIASAQTVAYRADTMEIVLPPKKGIEVKTHLAKGATLIYSWKTKNGELVNHDFHGEPVDAGQNEFESFILGKGVSQSQGSLIAPFTGVHGWYWKNTSTEPVTIVLNASGFYADIFKK